eukprot:CAMPEP_0176243238 /NCGR_PEP_ID=MMETSP0121_2-20121125/30822_1 /TAXON_ID=160619 /ORGANISM="Kryptoperidinium foliaceum, Strain CCMP 1326" /LENGTH=238 /DNA_ID=CAMNT_0017582827 /DNA_START=119 /DNA_END=831 /DNA_ORIENTATION=+
MPLRATPRVRARSRGSSRRRRAVAALTSAAVVAAARLPLRELLVCGAAAGGLEHAPVVPGVVRPPALERQPRHPRSRLLSVQVWDEQVRVQARAAVRGHVLRARRKSRWQWRLEHRKPGGRVLQVRRHARGQRRALLPWPVPPSAPVGRGAGGVVGVVVAGEEAVAGARAHRGEVVRLLDDGVREVQAPEGPAGGAEDLVHKRRDADRGRATAVRVLGACAVAALASRALVALALVPG